MPQSYKEYSSGELSATTYNVPFKYIIINDVNVIGFNGSKWTPLALDASSPTDAINKTVTLADTPAASYTKIRLYRATSTAQLVDFQNGSRLSESDLDTAYQQGLFVAQEIAEDASTSQFAAIATQGLQAGTSLSNFASQALTGDGATKVFSLTAFTPQTEKEEAYRVSIDGVMQSPIDSYEISMTNSTIEFKGTAAPPSGSKIVVVTAASAASSVSVDDVTIGLTSVNKAEIKDLGVTNDKLAGSITQDKLAGLSITNSELAGSITQDKLAGGITNAQLAGSITEDKLAGSIPTSKLAEVIDDDTMTSGVSTTSLASSSSIKAYVDASSPSLSSPSAVGNSGTAPSSGFLVIQINGAQWGSGSSAYYYGGLATIVADGHTYKQYLNSATLTDGNKYATATIPIKKGASWSISLTDQNTNASITANVEFHALS
jgi:hypothetical protein